MDPLLEIQGAIVTALKSSADVSALVGTRVLDNVPAGTALPYISIGPSDLTEDDADCIDGATFSIQIDAWSDMPGFVEVRKIAGSVRKALHDIDVDLSTNGLVLLQHTITRVMRDSAPGVTHAAITFEGAVEIN